MIDRTYMRRAAIMGTGIVALLLVGFAGWLGLAAACLWLVGVTAWAICPRRGHVKLND